MLEATAPAKEVDDSDNLLTQKTLILGETSDTEPTPAEQCLVHSTPQPEEPVAKEAQSNLSNDVRPTVTKANDTEESDRPKVLEGLNSISPVEQQELTKTKKERKKDSKNGKTKKSASSSRKGGGKGKGKGKRAKAILEKSKTLRKAKSEVSSKHSGDEHPTPEKKRRRLRKCPTAAIDELENATMGNRDIKANAGEKALKPSPKARGKNKDNKDSANKSTNTPSKDGKATAEGSKTTSKRKIPGANKADTQQADKVAQDDKKAEKKAKASRKSSAYHKAFKLATSLGLSNAVAKKRAKQVAKLNFFMNLMEMKMQQNLFRCVALFRFVCVCSCCVLDRHMQQQTDMKWCRWILFVRGIGHVHDKYHAGGSRAGLVS